jgi:formate hydrogenlyase subunit 6/NADH:ubiquinone oxidoreductase subunit I
MSVNNHWQNLIQFVRALHSTMRRGLGSPAVQEDLFPFRGTPVLRRDDQGLTPCTVCGLCVEICPTHCLQVRHRNDSVSLELDARRCMYCGLCAERCPVAAINVYATALLGRYEERSL